MMPFDFAEATCSKHCEEMRHTAQISHTAHTTRLYKCHTQFVQLNKHSVKKKEELYILKRWYRWWSFSSTALMWFILTEQHAHSLTLLLFSLSEMTMRMSLLCMKQWAVWSCHLQLLQHSSKCSDIWWHFKRMSYHVSDSWYNQQKSTHFDSKSESHWCTTADEFLFDLTWYRAVQTKCSHWAV
jgi:hypothetical protein